MVTTNEYATTTKAARRPIRGLSRAPAPRDGSTWTHPRGWSGHGRHTLGHPAGARERPRTTGPPPPAEHVWHPLRPTTCDGLVYSASRRRGRRAAGAGRCTVTRAR